MSRIKDTESWRVGVPYATFEGRPLREYPCDDGPRFGRPESRCCHLSCRMSALERAGKADAAARLRANAEAQDWARNWGKMLYDPAQHGRDIKRRKAAADVIRGMRAERVGYADAVRFGAWVGATM